MIKAIINRILQKLGYQILRYDSDELHRNSKNDLLDNLFRICKLYDFIPEHIVDIGANKGTWTRKVLHYFPSSFYTLIEPQERLFEYFKDLLKQNQNIKAYPIGVGNEAGSFKFTIVDRDDSCSFRYSEEEAREKGFTQVEIPVKTINQIVQEQEEHLPFPDLIKIDAEGLDLEVLEGATDCFGKTEIFMVEASVLNKNYKNSILVIANYMETKGYTLFDITDLNRPFNDNILWLVELVFVKKDGALMKKIWTNH